MDSFGNAESCAVGSVIRAARNRPAGDQPQWAELPVRAAPFG
jgi:hypothetical protein